MAAERRRDDPASEVKVSLALRTRRVGNVAVVTCRGKIIAGEPANSLHTHVKSVFPMGTDIVLHLGEVSFIDSSGLGAMVRLLANARANKGDIKLCALSGVVCQTLQMTNLLTVFEAHESEEQAVAAFYRRSRTASDASQMANFAVLCVDDCVDVLAYLRETLRSAGFGAFTSTNLHDALILMRAARPQLVLLGSSIMLRNGESTRHSFTNIDPKVPVLVLSDDFSVQEAGEAAKELLARVRSYLGSPGERNAAAG